MKDITVSPKFLDKALELLQLARDGQHDDVLSCAEEIVDLYLARQLPRYSAVILLVIAQHVLGTREGAISDERYETFYSRVVRLLLDNQEPLI